MPFYVNAWHGNERGTNSTIFLENGKGVLANWYYLADIPGIQHLGGRSYQGDWIRRDSGRRLWFKFTMHADGNGFTAKRKTSGGC